MRLVLDTNTVISGVLWKGAPHRLWERVRDGKADLITSPALMEELAEVLARPKFTAILLKSGLSVDAILNEMGRLAETVVPNTLLEKICRDSDDDVVLALAQTTKPDLIVSGDSDLLVLGSFESIRIVGAAEALAMIDAECGRAG